MLPVLHSRVDAGPRVPGRGLGDLRRRSCGPATSRRCSTRRWRTRCIHDLEHALFLGAALLFWWPAVALDPAPWRMPHPARALYVFLQMPQNTFLAVVLLNAPTVLYPHYATLERSWGPTALEDQRRRPGSCGWPATRSSSSRSWRIVVGWMRAEARDTARRTDRRGRGDGRHPGPRGAAGRTARRGARRTARTVSRGAAPRGRRGTAPDRHCRR